MVKISTISKPEGFQYSICLFSAFSQLNDIGLSLNELSYVKKVLQKTEEQIIEINHHPNFIFLTKVSLKKNEYQLGEKLRIMGNRILSNLSPHKPKEILVQSNAKQLSILDFAEGIALGSYQFLKYFSDKNKRQQTIQAIYLVTDEKAAVKELNAVVEGVYKARDLVNEPASFLTATQLAKEATKVGEKVGFKVEVLNKKKIETLKMGGLLAVNKGSKDPPTFTIMEYVPSKAVNAKPVMLIGKGVMYDTGGLSLKPTQNSMDFMKSDMSGSAAVIGAMIAVARTKLPIHLIGLIPATDNRPGVEAYAPGDVIRMFDGSTVEVLNTDAEGRMILADALAYAQKYKPELVIDIATLTGSAAAAIGKYGIVAMGTVDEHQFKKLENAGNKIHERIARFPFWDEYNELLKSDIADVKNIGGKEGGAITAGKFLERFTSYPWIHLDIAGIAFLSSDCAYRRAGGTGVGVRILFHFLKNYL